MSNQMRSSRFDDPNTSIFLQTQLEIISTKTYDRVYQDLWAKKYLPPVPDLANPGATSYAWDSFTMAGSAQILTQDATVLPKSDIGAVRNISGIRSIGTSFEFTIDDIDAARFAGLNLSDRKAMAARHFIEQAANSLFLKGDVSNSIPGFLTNPTVPLNSATNGNWLTNASITADQILSDMTQVVQAVINNSNGSFVPDTLLLPWAQFLKTQVVRIANTAVSVQEYFLQTNPMIKEIAPLIELNTAGANGVSRAVAYRKEPEMLGYVESLPFTIDAPQYVGYQMKVPVRAKVGGTVIFYPTSVSYLDGI